MIWIDAEGWPREGPPGPDARPWPLAGRSRPSDGASEGCGAFEGAEQSLQEDPYKAGPAGPSGPTGTRGDGGRGAVPFGVAPPGALPEEVPVGQGVSGDTGTASGTQHGTGRASGPQAARIPWTRELLALALQMAVRANGGPVTLHRFVQMAGISDAAVYRLFPGGWPELLEKAGMEAAPRSSKKYSDDDLLREYHRLVVTLEKMPTWSEIDRHGRVSSPTLQRRFGRMRDVKRRYREFLLKHVKTGRNAIGNSSHQDGAVGSRPGTFLRGD